jgi:flagellar biosynthesis protein FliR
MNLPIKLVVGFAVFIVIALVLSTLVTQQFSGAENTLRSFVSL